MAIPRWIELRGGSENNLRNIDVDIPLHRLTVVCGVSGSGKTSLALDTLYAEGQRRYIESFSAYTRQFLARIEKPRFHALNHLPPSLSVTRGDRTRNNRSTVGTASELLEPMRILFSLIAELYCRGCGERIVRHTPQSVAMSLSELSDARAMLGFEMEWKSKSDLSLQLFDLQSAGFVRVVLGKNLIELSGDRSAWASKIPARGVGIVIVERFRAGSSVNTSNLVSSLEMAFEQSEHGLIVLVEGTDPQFAGSLREIDDRSYREYRFAKELRCESCRISYPAAEPRLFNFNSPIGACPTCAGFGETSSIDFDKVVPDRSMSLKDGAIAPWRTPSYSHELEELLALARDHQLPIDVPVSRLTAAQWSIVQHGVPERDFGGLDGFFAWLERKKYKMHVRAFLARWRTYSRCPECQGARLSPDALAYRYGDFHFWSWCDQEVSALRIAIASLKEHWDEDAVSDPIALRTALREVESRLQYLEQVGLGYLSLNRTMHTLSGGEAQRVQLTTLLGSDLVDMLYVLDEPTVGLHPTDTARVAIAIQQIVDRGNTVLLIEHEPYLLFRADHVLEVGPGAGELGGNICFAGSPKSWKRSGTLTAKRLFQETVVDSTPRKLGRSFLRLEGASGRDLKGETFEIPVHALTVVVGVSGSGKSSLVMDTFVPAMMKHLGEDAGDGLPYSRLTVAREIEGCVAIDQSPIAKSIRSTPATFTKAMDEIRSVFGALPEARGGGMTESHFSFNSAAGRCPECEGLGFTVVDMQFMADIRMECTHCRGARFRPEILQVRYRDRSIAEVLAMSVSAAQTFFRGESKVQRRLQSLIDIGLGYLPLGQSLSALSAGEGMRLKLASHLQDRRNHIIVMDEPTTGLHFADVDRLLGCLNLLIDRGNTVLLVEHNEQVIRAADYVVELGPGAGPGGGKLLYSGPRDTFFASADTPTTRALLKKFSVSDRR